VGAPPCTPTTARRWNLFGKASSPDIELGERVSDTIDQHVDPVAARVVPAGRQIRFSKDTTRPNSILPFSQSRPRYGCNLPYRHSMY
jgi:hypothetical protein